MCVCEKQEQIRIFFSRLINYLLLLMSQVACRPTCVDRGAGAAAAVGSGRTLLFIFQSGERHGRREGVAGVDGQ